MEESAEVIPHPTHWSVRPSGMASTGQPLSRMQLKW
jgi:transposase InsO family protein